MMRSIFMALLVIAAVVLQGTVFSVIRPGGVAPELTLVLVVAFAIFEGPVHGGILGFLAGLAGDITFGRPLGFSSMSMTLIGYSVGLLEKKVFKDNLLVPAFMVFLATIFNEFLTSILIQMVGIKLSIYKNFSSVVLPLAIVNLVATLVLYTPLYKINKWLQSLRLSHR
jgi:rod shape-determining protein MreD